MPPRRAAQELGRRAAAEAQPIGLAEVDEAGLPDGCGHAHVRSGAWSVRREARAGRRPEREVTAGRVPERSDVAEVERRVHVGEEVDRGGDVGNVAVQTPPDVGPIRRYSTFHAAYPRAA